MPQTVTYPYGQGTRTESLDALLARTDTRAFIVVRDDSVVFETYPGSTREAVNTSFSSAKSFDSAMIGAAIADGYIGSVDDPVIRYVPELGGRGFDALTIRDLLMMSSGIRYIGNDEQPFYMSPFGDDTRTYYSADMRRVALSVTASDAPVGAHFRYNNYHPLIEGLIIERATGMPVAKYLEQRIWQPMGAEFPASWSLDSEQSGFEKMESGLNVRAIDFARFGLLFLHDGYWNGRQILPAGWVREATSPLRPDPRVWEVFTQWPARGGFYKYHWWGLNNPDGTYDFMARGAYDQYIYVAPRKNVVIVRMGNKPDAGMEWGLVLHAIVDALP
jgi:CubicO group peptidase (beta-lactamase class C family)